MISFDIQSEFENRKLCSKDIIMKRYFSKFLEHPQFAPYVDSSDKENVQFRNCDDAEEIYMCLSRIAETAPSSDGRWCAGVNECVSRLGYL